MRHNPKLQPSKELSTQAPRVQLHSAWFVHGLLTCILYLNGFSNALGTISVAERHAHSQFNTLGVVHSALLGRFGC